MADFTLKNGREIVFDFDAITLAEYRTVADRNCTREDSDRILAKVMGLTVDELNAVGFREWRKLTAAFWESAVSPLDDPN